MSIRRCIYECALSNDVSLICRRNFFLSLCHLCCFLKRTKKKLFKAVQRMTAMQYKNFSLNFRCVAAFVFISRSLLLPLSFFSLRSFVQSLCFECVCVVNRSFFFRMRS